MTEREWGFLREEVRKVCKQEGVIDCQATDGSDPVGIRLHLWLCKVEVGGFDKRNPGAEVRMKA